MNCTRTNTALKRRSKRERGIALIMTLAILVLITLLVVAFAISMRVEQQSSKNFNDLIKSRELARAAVDQAVAQIRTATTRSLTVSNYVTFPGVVYQMDQNGLMKPAIVLSSAPTSTDTNNMNNGAVITGQNTIEYPTAPGIPAGWIYVATNGTQSAFPPLNAPLVGRFAYWVDDEASKININTAGQRPPTSPDPLGYSATNEVDLTMLQMVSGSITPATFASSVQINRSTRPYSSIQEVITADPNIQTNDFTANQFYLTTSSIDTNDLDAFGRQRLLVTGLKPAIDIADTTGTNNASAYTRLSDNALTILYKPVTGTFADKYNTAPNPHGLQQIIANIIGYQLDLSVANPQVPDGGGDPPPYLALVKAPYINKVKVVYEYDNIANQLVRTISVEAYYPYSADGAYAGDVTKDEIEVKNLPVAGALPVNSPVRCVYDHAGPTANYYVFKQKSPDTGPPVALPYTIPAATGVIFNYYLKNATRIDCARVPLKAVLLTTPGAGNQVYQDSEVNDPCLNEDPASWTTFDTTHPDNFGNPNSVYSPPETPPSKLHMRGGPMKSIGELGYIHKPPPASQSTLWKYLTLQPQAAAEKSAKQIPDWALLDLFTVGGMTPGRININNHIVEFSGTRLIPLEALLNNLFPVGTRDTVATAIYTDDNTVRNDAFGMSTVDPSTGKTLGIFDTIGEICEVPGLIPPGASTEAAKEETIRRIANLITVRSNAFTIWVVAQSIRDVNRDGKYNPVDGDFITGETKVQAIVDRFEEPVGTPQFRVLYYRYINQ